jgi:membrane protein YqaA with SNARE-associated domain
LENWGLWGLFLGSFLASTILPFSSEALFIGAVAMGNSIWLCVFIAALGNSLGGVVSFYLGRLGKWEWLEKYFKISKEKIEKSKEKIEKYKEIAAFFAWLPFIGDIIAVGLGFMRFSAFKSILYMTIGRLVRFTVVGSLMTLF